MYSTFIFLVFLDFHLSNHPFPGFCFFQIGLRSAQQLDWLSHWLILKIRDPLDHFRWRRKKGNLHVSHSREPGLTVFIPLLVVPCCLRLLFARYQYSVSMRKMWQVCWACNFTIVRESPTTEALQSQNCHRYLISLSSQDIK